MEDEDEELVRTGQGLEGQGLPQQHHGPGMEWIMPPLPGVIASGSYSSSMGVHASLPPFGLMMPPCQPHPLPPPHHFMMGPPPYPLQQLQQHPKVPNGLRVGGSTLKSSFVRGQQNQTGGHFGKKVGPFPRAAAAGYAVDDGRSDFKKFMSLLEKSDPEAFSYVTEDTRLSTLQKKLSREGGSSFTKDVVVVPMALALQISHVILLPENSGYVERAWEVICEALMDVIVGKSSSSSSSATHAARVRQESSRALGRVAFVLSDRKVRTTFQKFYSWLWESFNDAAHGKRGAGRASSGHGKKTPSSSSSKSAALIIEALTEAFRLRPSHLSDAEIGSICDNLQEELEKTESRAIMMSTVQSLIEVSRWKPKIFEPRFHDIVDILIGWHLDTTTWQSSERSAAVMAHSRRQGSLSNTTEEVRVFASKTLIGWHSFWILDLDFSLSLLKQFVEDVEGFTYDLSAASSDKSPFGLSNICNQILAVVQIFNTVVRSLTRQNGEIGGGAFADKTLLVQDSPQRILHWFESILKCLIEAGPLHEGVLLTGHQTTLLLLENGQPLLAECCKTGSSCGVLLSNFVESTSFSILNHVCSTTKVEVLKFFRKLFIVYEANHNCCSDKRKLLVQKIIKENLIEVAAIGEDTNVRLETANLFRVLLDSKDIGILQDVYGALTSVFLSSVESIMAVPGKDWAQARVRRRRVQNCERKALLVLQCLSNLIKGKGSVLSLWALDPSVFKLLLPCIGDQTSRQPTSKNFADSSAPWLQLTLIEALASLCRHQHHFVANSGLVTEGRNNLPSLTSGYFEAALEAATFVLGESRKREASPVREKPVLAIIAWIWSSLKDAVQVEKGGGTSVFLSARFRDLMEALLLYCNSTMSTSVIKECLAFASWTNKCCPFDFFSDGIIDIKKPKAEIDGQLYSLLRCVVNKSLQCGDAAIRKVSSDLLLSIIEVPCLQKCRQDGQQSLECSTVRREKSVVQVRRSSLVLRPLDSQLLFDALLKSPFLKDIEQEKAQEIEVKNICAPYLELAKSLATSSCAQETTTKGEPLQAVQRWYWICHQLAQYCVENKLKTHLGKAQATLTTIEKVIRHLAACVNVDDISVNVRGCHRLLLFLELLEKSMINAWDGCAFHWPLPGGGVLSAAATGLQRAPSQNSSTTNSSQLTFFTANKKTCVDWLARLRTAAVQLAFNTGDIHFVIHSATAALDGSQTSELWDEKQANYLVCMAALSLTKLGADLDLSGLYAWSREKTGSKFAWIKPLVDFSKGYYERAISGCRIFTADKKVYNPCDASDDTDLLDTCALSCLKKQSLEFREMIHRQTGICAESVISIKEPSGYKLSFDYLEVLSSFDNGIVPAEMGASLRAHDPVPFRKEDLLKRTNVALMATAAKFQQMFYSGRSLAFPENTNIEDEVDEMLADLACNHSKTLDTDDYRHMVILKAVRDDLGAIMAGSQGGKLELVRKPSRVVALAEQFTGSQKLVSLSMNASKDSHYRLDQMILLKKWNDTIVDMKNSRLVSSELFDGREDIGKGKDISRGLALEIARISRKGRNISVAKEYVMKALSMSSIDCSRDADFESTVVAFCGQGPSFVEPHDAECIRQAAKITQRTNPSFAVKLLANVVGNLEPGPLMASPDVRMEKLLEVSSRSLMNISRILLRNADLMDEVGLDVAELLSKVEGVPLMNLSGHEIGFQDAHHLIGRLLNAAVQQTPRLAKAWRSLAHWALSMGEERLSWWCEMSSRHKMLSNREMDAIIASDPEISSKSLDKKLFALVSSIKLPSGNSGEDKSEVMKGSLTSLGISGEETIESLVKIWEGVQKRVYLYHELAVDSYFNYLRLAEGDGGGGAITSVNLRLLKLMVRNALELEDSLQKGLESTPSRNWKTIIPQLFSRLNHPVVTVRRQISDLLCRIAKDLPHLIMYPAVVGSIPADLQSTLDRSSSASPTPSTTNEKGRLDVVDTETPVELRSAHAKIVESMMNDDATTGRTIERLNLVVAELRRISVLWDELWLVTIQQLRPEVNRRLKRMEEEIRTLAMNASLSEVDKSDLAREKYNITFKPVLFVLDKVASALTLNASVPREGGTFPVAETPNEHRFVGRFGDFIASMMAKLRDPPNPSKPREVWDLLGKLQADLMADKLRRNSGGGTLRLSDISSALAALRSDIKTAVPLPGGDGNVFIETFDSGLVVLPTKTRPKRLSILGSDGRKYAFLLKGLEDLHLDERIMQFLKIANTMMDSNTKKDSGYVARHYSVIPLGPRSGLIQWVQGATPMFSLFKKWQQRQQSIDAACQNNGSSKSSSNDNSKVAKKRVAYEKPAEAFYNKLIPLLRDKGIVANLEDRKEWPVSVLKQVYQELVADTPDSIVSEAVHFSSSDSKEWFALTDRLTKSFAVMSIIGYLIGLGDRHLDNLLIDLSSGEVIHIDYNVCFEKGRNLRIPERVPCRLTQNIVRSFGLGGASVGSKFRLTCSKVLGVMRGGMETLMTLLEAFVYDPLIDWAPELEVGGGGLNHAHLQLQQPQQQQLQDGRKEMETEITFSMLSVRVAEMKGPWLENQAQLLQALGLLEDRVNAWQDIKQNLAQSNERLTKLHLSMSVLKEAESNPSHRLRSLRDHYVEFSLVEAALRESRLKVTEMIKVNEKWLNLHQRALTCLFNPAQISRWIAEVNDNKISHAFPLPSSIVKEFLDNCGQSSLSVELREAEGFLLDGMKQFNDNILTCTSYLGHYSTVLTTLPQSLRLKHRTPEYIRWLRRIDESFSVETCQGVLHEFSLQFSDRSSERELLKQHRIAGLNLQLNEGLQVAREKLENLFDRMLKEGLVGAGVKAALTSRTSNFQMNFASLFFDGHYAAAEEVAGTVVNHLKLAVNQLEALEDDEGRLQTDERNLGFDDVLVQNGLVERLKECFDSWCGKTAAISREQQQHSKGYEALQKSLKQLRNLCSTFFSLILPEGLKLFLREDSSVIAVAMRVEELVLSCGWNLTDLIEELSQGLKQGSSATASAVVDAKNVARQFKEFKGSLKDEVSVIGVGEMLFLAFNSLIDDMENATNEARKTISEEIWQPLNAAAIESKSLAVITLLDAEAAELVDSVLCLRRILLLHDCFTLWTRSSICFKAESSSIGQLFPQMDEIEKPVQDFARQFFKLKLQGLTSLCLSCWLSQEATVHTEGDDFTTPKGKLSFLELSTACKGDLKDLDAQLTSFSDDLMKLERIKSMDHKAEILNALAQISQLMYSSFQWHHEGYLGGAEEAGPAADVLGRSQMLGQIRATVATVLANQEAMSGLMAKYQELHSSVEQRLKWASGANPDILEVFDAYTSAAISLTESLKTLSSTAKAACTTATAMLHFESLWGRHSPESLGSDSAFVALVSECQNSASLKAAQERNAVLTEQELLLFSLNPPIKNGDDVLVNDFIIDGRWISETEAAISMQAKKVHEDLQLEQSRLKLAKDSLDQLLSGHVRMSVWVHQKLIADVGALLRSIEKDYDVPDIRIYLTKYKAFAGHLNALLTAVQRTENDAQNCEVENVGLNASLVGLKDLMGPVYEDLLIFIRLFKDEPNMEAFKKHNIATVSHAAANPENSPQQPPQTTTTEVSGCSLKEEKNAFALNVLRRIRAKLEGKEPEAAALAGGAFSVVEQVDFVVKNATNIDNLALLYEGWTAWI